VYYCKQCGWTKGGSAHWVHAPIVWARPLTSRIIWALQWIPHTFNTRVKKVLCVVWEPEWGQWEINCERCYEDTYPSGGNDA